MSVYEVISEVFIGDPINFRKDIYDCWLEGLSVDAAAQKIKESTEPVTIDGLNIDKLIHEDILDSYRIFGFFREQLFNNSWNIVDFNNDEKKYMCNRYLKLDEDLVREIVGIGIGEKKRSIIKTMKTPSPRAQVLMDAIKVMFEYIDRVDPSKSLLTSLIKRFHIKEELAKSYLSLLFLLLDTKEKDTVKNRPYMEWDIINDVLWFVLSHWTEEVVESSVLEKAIDIQSQLASSGNDPTRLALSESCLKAFQQCGNYLTKNGSERKNWQMKPSDTTSVESIARRVCTIMSQLKEEKCRFRAVCEAISKHLGSVYHGSGMTLEQVKKSLQQCSDFLCKAQAEHAYYISSFVTFCYIYLSKYYSKHKSFYVQNQKYF